jgi:hypothetical protein
MSAVFLFCNGFTRSAPAPIELRTRHGDGLAAPLRSAID